MNQQEERHPVDQAGGGDAAVEINRARDFERQGRWDNAARAYRDIIRRRPGNAIALLRLSQAYAELGREELAAKAYSWGGEMGDPYVPMFSAPQTDPEIKQLIARADQRMKRVLTELHSRAVGVTAETFPDDDLGRIREAIWVASHETSFDYADAAQKPWAFYIPGLAPRPYFEREDFPWIADVEADFAAIKSEMETTLDIERDSMPYIHGNVGTTSEAAPLTDSRGWTAMYLYCQGVRDEDVCRRFPRAAAMAEKTPLATVNGVPLEAFYSILQPGGHIVPHFGVSNHWLTVHLPLIAPGNGIMRAGPVSRMWHEGECLIFDDSFDHEAINASDKIRIVLILGVWHPDLSEAERAAIDFTFAMRQSWLDTRKRDIMQPEGPGRKTL